MKFDISTDINRPIDEVFAYISDATNAPDWVSAVLETKETETPRIGSHATQTGRFMGRKFEFTSEVTEYEPNHVFAFLATEPFRLTNRIVLTPQGTGTHLDVRMEGEVGSFFKIAEPLVQTMAQRQFTSDYANLKDMLEARVATPSLAQV